MKNLPLDERIKHFFPWTVAVFQHFPWLVQFVNFSLVGVINLLLSYVLYSVCIYLGMHHQIANQVSFWLSVLNGYVLNKCWVFDKKHSGRTKAEAIKYFSVYGFNFLLGIFLLYLYVDVWEINKYLAPIISLPVTVPLNYILNRKWVFNKQ